MGNNMIKESFQQQHEKKVIEMLSIENISIIDLILIKKGFNLDYDYAGYMREYSKDINYNNVNITMKIKHQYDSIIIAIYKNDIRLNEILKEQPHNNNIPTIDYFAQELNTYFEYLGI